MGRRDFANFKHDLMSSKEVHGTPDQISRIPTTLKCQDNQVQGTCNRDKRGRLHSDGSTQVSICKYMQRYPLQMVIVQEEQSTLVEPLDKHKRTNR